MWAIKKVIEDEEIDCGLILARSVDDWCDDKAAKMAKAAHDQLVALGLDCMKDIFYTTDPSRVEVVSSLHLPLVATIEFLLKGVFSIQVLKMLKLLSLSQMAQCGRTNLSSAS